MSRRETRNCVFHDLAKSLKNPKNGTPIFFSAGAFSALRAENRIPTKIFRAPRGKQDPHKNFPRSARKTGPLQKFSALRAENRTPSIFFRAPRGNQDPYKIDPRSARKTGPLQNKSALRAETGPLQKFPPSPRKTMVLSPQHCAFRALPVPFFFTQGHITTGQHSMDDL